MLGRTKIVLRFGAVAALLAVVACAKVYRNHGYVPDDAELAKLVVGVDTREAVAEKVGRPSLQGLLNDDGWFYVQSRFEHFGPQPPAEIERQVVAINFDAGGRVSNIGRYGLEEGRVIELSRRVTESSIKGVSFIGQLLGNVGRINAEEMLR